MVRSIAQENALTYRWPCKFNHCTVNRGCALFSPFKTVVCAISGNGNPDLMSNEERIAARGSVIPLILIALTLLGALGYVVFVSKQTGELSEKDVQMAAAARLTQFPASVHAEVARMLQEGVPLHALDFSREGKGREAVFARIAYENPPLGMGATTDWGFHGVTEAGEGWFVSGMGSDDKNGKDVIAFLTGLSLQGCQIVNKALGLAATPVTEAVTVDLGKPGAVDAVAGSNAWSFNANLSETPPNPQTAACVRNGVQKGGDPNYVYYHVIVAK